MRRSRRVCVSSMVGVLAFGLGVPLALALPGCGGAGAGEGEMVKPEVAPAVSAKDSMTAFLQQSKELHQNQKGKKKARR